mmetsp:Transcript_8304/g.14307  ORF Transcript_8304/g.14307 Transcript_8304/m.14307 type:complete len:157 (-) Transcript_8304:43-513(-)
MVSGALPHLPPRSNDGALGTAHGKIDEAFNIMQGNVRLLTDRDAQLSELHDKSSALSDTSEVFSRRARNLKWEMRWQHYRLFALVGTLIAWTALLYVFRAHMVVYTIVSALFFAIAFVALRFLIREDSHPSRSFDTKLPHEDSWLPPYPDEEQPMA